MKKTLIEIKVKGNGMILKEDSPEWRQANEMFTKDEKIENPNFFPIYRDWDFLGWFFGNLDFPKRYEKHKKEIHPNFGWYNPKRIVVDTTTEIRIGK